MERTWLENAFTKFYFPEELLRFRAIIVRIFGGKNNEWNKNFV